MVKPSLAQNRLGGPPAEVPIPLIPHKSSATCCGTLFFKPAFELSKNPKPCVSAFGTQATRPQPCSWRTKAEYGRILSNCSFQISRVSNQNRLHLCHDRLWFLGDIGFFTHPASATTWTTVSELTGTQSFPTPSHSFFIGNSSLLSLCFSWHSFVRWRAMLVLD